MKRILLAGMLVLMATTITLAQFKVNVGVSTAINSTFILDKGLNEDPQYVSVQSFEMAPLGFRFGTHFGKKFGLSLDGILTNYKQIYEMKERVQQAQQTAQNIADLNFDMQYLHLPVLMNFMSGSDKRARMNFNFGPQLSILTSGTQNLVFGPEAASQILDIASIPDLPAGADIEEYIPGSVDNGDGTFTMPSNIPTEGLTVDLLEKNAEDEIAAFRNQEFHLRGGFGLDFDLSKSIYVNLAVQADYSFTDMRNGDLLDQLEGGASISDIFGNRANLAVGAQITVNYMFGGTRSFLAMEKKAEANRKLLARR